MGVFFVDQLPVLLQMVTKFSNGIIRRFLENTKKKDVGILKIRRAFGSNILALVENL